MSDAIIGELTVRLTDKLSKTSSQFARQNDEQQVKMFLEEVQTPNSQVIQQGIDLVNDIHQSNYENQMAASNQNNAIVEENLANIAQVNQAMPDLLNIASQPQKTPDQASQLQDIAAVQQTLNEINTGNLAQVNASSSTNNLAQNIQSVTNFLEGLAPSAAQSSTMQA